MQLYSSAFLTLMRNCTVLYAPDLQSRFAAQVVNASQKRQDALYALPPPFMVSGGDYHRPTKPYRAS